MAVASVTALSLEKLYRARQEGKRGRYVDLQLGVEYQGQRLLTVGGRWDKEAHEFCPEVWDADEECPVSPAETEHVIELHKGQVAAMRWFCDWFRRYCVYRSRKEAGLPVHGMANPWREFKRVTHVLLHGGRRGGKTYMALVWLAVFAIHFPGSIAWCLSPIERRTKELVRALTTRILLADWYTPRGLCFTLVNGTDIDLQTASKTEAIRSGGTDIALLNEPQDMKEDAFAELLGNITDNGGLILLAANPPETVKGEWVYNMHEGIAADDGTAERAIPAIAFALDPEDNPHIDGWVREAARRSLSDRVYRRRWLGEWLPPGDQIIDEFHKRLSCRAVPAYYEDITREHSKRILGHACDHILATDHDYIPHMVGIVFKVYRRRPDWREYIEAHGPPLTDQAAEVEAAIPVPAPVADADADAALAAEPAPVIYWAIAEVKSPRADEMRFIDDIENLRDPLDPRRRLLAPETTAIITDATAKTQRKRKTESRDAWSFFVQRGWRHLFTPIPDADVNPDKDARVMTVNRLFCDSYGKRRLFVTPACKHVIKSLEKWAFKKNGDYAHDFWSHAMAALGYFCYRFEGLPPDVHAAPELWFDTSEARSPDWWELGQERS